MPSIAILACTEKGRCGVYVGYGGQGLGQQGRATPPRVSTARGSDEETEQDQGSQSQRQVPRWALCLFCMGPANNSSQPGTKKIEFGNYFN